MNSPIAIAAAVGAIAMSAFKFHFKTRAIKDESGKEIGRTVKQPSLEIQLPTPTAAGIIELLTSGSEKEVKFVLDSVADNIYLAARGQFDDVIEGFTSPEQQVTASMLDYDKLTIGYLANIPKAQRGGAAISEEDWATFFADYLAVMVAATGKEVFRIENQIEHFKKPTRVKNNGKILAVMLDQLDIYIANTPNLEDNAACADKIRTKFAKWLEENQAVQDEAAL